MVVADTSVIAALVADTFVVTATKLVEQPELLVTTMERVVAKESGMMTRMGTL